MSMPLARKLLIRVLIRLLLETGTKLVQLTTNTEKTEHNKAALHSLLNCRKNITRTTRPS